MKILYPLLITVAVFLFLFGCGPVNIDNEDEVAYQNAKIIFDSTNRYDSAAAAFEEMIDEYPWSSRIDNAHYYAGRSYQKWGKIVNSDSLKIVKYQNAFNHFSAVFEKSSYYDESLLRKAESADSISLIDNDLYSTEQVKSLYYEVITHFPASESAVTAQKRYNQL